MYLSLKASEKTKMRERERVMVPFCSQNVVRERRRAAKGFFGAM